MSGDKGFFENNNYFNDLMNICVVRRRPGTVRHGPAASGSRVSAPASAACGATPRLPAVGEIVSLRRAACAKTMGMSTIQIGIIAFAIGIIAMFAWFSWLFATDPSNVFGRRPRQPPADDQDSGSN